MAIRSYNGIEYPNRQLKNWFCILYPETNPTHKVAADLVEWMPEAIMMKHDRSFNKNGDPKEVHYHVWLHFDSPKWLYTIMKNLCLEDDSLHLWKSFDEIKRKEWKSPDDYVIYMTHVKEEDKEPYDYNSFLGGRRSYAIELCSNLDLSEQEMINKCLNDIRDLHKANHLNMQYMIDIYSDLINRGNAYIINKKWSFFRSIIEDMKGH